MMQAKRLKDGAWWIGEELLSRFTLSSETENGITHETGFSLLLPLIYILPSISTKYDSLSVLTSIITP